MTPRPMWMLWALGVVAAAAGVACRDDALEPSGEAVAMVEVAPPSATVVLGESVPLTATALDAAGNVVTGRRVLWVSADPNFATVSENGVVTGKYVGTVPIAASVEGKTATAQIVVTPVPVSSVRVSPTARDVVVGGTVQLKAEALDGEGGVLADRPVTWASSRTNVATVNANGLVTGISPGGAAITATIEGKSAAAAVNVTQAPVASVAVSPGSATLVVGSTRQLQAEPRNAAGQALSGRTVTWASNAPQTASVTSGGLVVALTPGRATITATSEGKSGSATITVELVPVDRVEVDPPNVRIDERESTRLVAWVFDSRNTIVTGHTVTWSSSEPAVATVDNSGVVRGIRRGTATITATAGGKSGTARVRVDDD
jgi:trimeric autotransporter adhesin